MFDNPTDNHTDIEVPLYYKLRFTKLKNGVQDAKKMFLACDAAAANDDKMYVFITIHPGHHKFHALTIL